VSEDATAIRERPQLPAPPDVTPELDDEFFHRGSSAELDLTDLEEERDNPELSPAQSQRRRQLRRQVTLLIAALALFSMAAPLLKLG
jgi:class 3 adenylate cyclase